MIARPVPPRATAIEDLPGDLPAVLDLLADTHPTLALAMVRALANARVPALRATGDRLMTALADETRLDTDVDEVVMRAVRAQAAFELWSDQRIDAVLADLASAFTTRAEELALVTVGETRIGNTADKTIRNIAASQTTYQSLVERRLVGSVAFDAAGRVTTVTSPVGVVLAVLPITGPVACAIVRTLTAVKTRNAILLSFPHRAFGVGQFVGGIVRDILVRHGAPAGLVQVVQQTGRKIVRRFMCHQDVSLVMATGGAGLVKAAYSSGTPAIGLGPSTSPVFVSADANLDSAARALVSSKAFDNGLICGAEHNLVVDARVVAPFIGALEQHGAAVLTPAEERDFCLQAVDVAARELQAAVVGQPADIIARTVGISRPYPIRLVVIPTTEEQGLYDGEKLAPVLSMFTVPNEDEGLRLCRALLDGVGHTAVIHTDRRQLAERFASEIGARRIVVNRPAAAERGALTGGGVARPMSLSDTSWLDVMADGVMLRDMLVVRRVVYPAESRG